MLWPANTPSAELTFDSIVSNRSENHGFTAVTWVDPSSYLVDGTNVVAAQVINSYLSNSSDCFIDVRLTAEAAGPGESSLPVAQLQQKAGQIRDRRRLGKCRNS